MKSTPPSRPSPKSKSVQTVVLSYLGEMSEGRRGIPPFTSTINAALSKTLCDLYGVTIKVNDESLNHLALCGLCRTGASVGKITIAKTNVR